MKVFKHTVATMLSFSMLVSLLPIAAQANNTAMWKFDFGYADNIADGYIGVTPDMSYTSNTVDGL